MNDAAVCLRSCTRSRSVTPALLRAGRNRCGSTSAAGYPLHLKLTVVRERHSTEHVAKRIALVPLRRPQTPSTADDRHQPQPLTPKRAGALNPTSNTRDTLVMPTFPPDAGGYVVCSLGCGSASPFPSAVLCRAGAWRSWVTVGVRAWRGCSDSSSESSSRFSTACLP
jgi:hypothetical protein